MKSNFIHEAVRKISPNCGVVVRDNDTTKISFVDNPDNITIQQIEDAIPLAEADFNATQYQRDRAEQYPSYANQFDTIYHQGIDAWKAEIKAIKDAHPKPE